MLDDLCDKEAQGAMAITLSFMALGSGAAVSYSYLIGLNIHFPFLCPVCPQILSLGPPN